MYSVHNVIPQSTRTRLYKRIVIQTTALCVWIQSVFIGILISYRTERLTNDQLTYDRQTHLIIDCASFMYSFLLLLWLRHSSVCFVQSIYASKLITSVIVWTFWTLKISISIVNIYQYIENSVKSQKRETFSYANMIIQ